MVQSLIQAEPWLYVLLISITIIGLQYLIGKQ